MQKCNSDTYSHSAIRGHPILLPWSHQMLMAAFGLRPSATISIRALEGERPRADVGGASAQHMECSIPSLPTYQRYDIMLKVNADRTYVLVGILSAVSDEVDCMLKGLPPAAAAAAGAGRQVPLAKDSAPLSALVQAVWKGLMSTLQLLALNQAGFRPLNAEVGV